MLSVIFLANALFWAILSGCVALSAFIVGAIRIFSNHFKNKGEGGLSLYVNFVDDLQQELSRLHAQIVEERQEAAARRRELEIEIERKAVEIQGLRDQCNQLLSKIPDQPGL